MNSLKTLIGYEYKKILSRKSTWIVLSIAVILTLFSCFEALFGDVSVDGKQVYTHYEEMTVDRAYAIDLTGRKVDDALINEMQEGYRLIPDVPLAGASEEYQTYARPYRSIYCLVRDVTKDFLNIDGREYYNLRNAMIINMLKEKNLTDQEVSKNLELNAKIKTPFVFQYTGGYQRIMMNAQFLGMIATFVIAICLAPIFANEYSDRTDQLILTSRYGKNKAISAKLITGVSFGLIVSVILLLLMIIPTLLVYGFDGWNAPIQLFLNFSTYPMTIWKGSLLLYGMILISSILISSLSMFLSAKLKSAFSTIVILSTFTIACVFVNVPDQYRFLYRLVNLLPTNVMSVGSIYSNYFYTISGKCFTIYQTVPVVYTIGVIVLMVFGYQSFKKHQVG